MKEHWHPSIKIVDIAERYIEFVTKNSVPIAEVPCLITKTNHKVQSLKLVMLGIMAVKLCLVLLLCFADYKSDHINNNIIGEISTIKVVSENKVVDWYQNQDSLNQPPLSGYIYIGLDTFFKTFGIELA